MLLKDSENYIEIEFVDRVPEGLPTPGDTELSVKVCSDGFCGQTLVWTSADCLANFLNELTELEKRRQGVAALKGLIGEAEFLLRVRSVDRRGHMVIEGRLTKYIYRGEGGPYHHVMEFGFEFDPTLLPKLLIEFPGYSAWSARGRD